MSEHPLLLELLTTCKNHDLKDDKAYLAFELYMELCAVQNLWEVEHHFNEKLKMFYFNGKVKKNGEEHNVYVPWTMDKSLSPELIEELQANLSPNNKSLIIVFKDRDSTSTYYKITQGLVQPDSPEAAQIKKNEEKKKFDFQKDLEKCRKKLYAKALESERLSSN